jgi:hypothetical protein
VAECPLSGPRSAERCIRYLLLPSTQDAAVDAIAARHLCDACAGLCRFFENPPFVRLAKPAPVPLTRPWNDGAFQPRGGISHRTKRVTKR